MLSKILESVAYVMAVIAGGAMLFALNRALSHLTSAWPEVPFFWVGRWAKMKREVRDRLVELCTRMDSGRVCAILFHNGKDFRLTPDTRNIAFRMTCFEEYCASGAAPALREMNGQDASVIVNDLLQMTLQGTGCRCFREFKAHNLRENQNAALRNVRYSCVKCLPEGVWKNELLEQGATGVAFCFLLNPENENVMGFLVSVWMSDQYRDHKVYPSETDAMPGFAANVSYTVAEMKSKFPRWHRWL